MLDREKVSETEGNRLTHNVERHTLTIGLADTVAAPQTNSTRSRTSGRPASRSRKGVRGSARANRQGTWTINALRTGGIAPQEL